MRKIYFCSALIFFSSILFSLKVKAQCTVVDSINSIYNFLSPSGGQFTDYLCAGTDSVGTTGVAGYYDGDGYRINLVAGSEITFSIDSCSGNAASITINDSSQNIISGAYSASACPNSLDFTAPYTGEYIVVLNRHGNCGGGGNHLIGEVHAKIKTGTTVPDCPSSGIANDTICGATVLHLDSTFVEGNSGLAFPTDPMDHYIDSIGGSTCSSPNNTLWYSFTPDVNIDTLYIVLTVKAGGNFHCSVSVFPANSVNDPCHSNVAFLGCDPGPNDMIGIDTVKNQQFGLIAGRTYYYMIDGYNGAAGEFSIALESSGFFNSINEFTNNRIMISPNPAIENAEIQINDFSPGILTLTNAIGQTEKSYAIKNRADLHINFNGFDDGLYFISFQSGHRFYTGKFLINR